MKVLKILATMTILSLGLAACAGSPQRTIDSQRQMPSISASPLVEQLRKNAPYARDDITIAVGECADKTGKFQDTEQLRYSRAVTQACADYLTYILHEAGFTVVDRSPYNLELLANEHQMANTYGRFDEQGNPVNTGLIQENRPTGGIVGANLVWSAAISSYASSVSTGGGGIEVFGAGFNYQEADARVAVITHITGMNSVIVDALQTQSFVSGSRAGLTLNRIASLFGATTFFSAELGMAAQMPVDMAFEDALIANVVGVLDENKEAFYMAKNVASIEFDLQTAAADYGTLETP